MQRIEKDGWVSVLCSAGAMKNVPSGGEEEEEGIATASGVCDVKNRYFTLSYV